jgi:hypothetical protein
MRLLVFAALALAFACGGRTERPPDEPLDAGAGGQGGEAPPPLERSGKLDVLFVVDNTTTGFRAHELLASTIPYFLDRLVNPRCVNGLGQIVDEPASAEDPCSVGLRDFAPVADIHLGIVTTSIGGHGADTCSEVSGVFHPEQDDGAHLIDRTGVGTYQGLGFLAWDPDQQLAPPGEADIGALGADLAAMIRGAGNLGCGFEAPLESMYRFLVDPAPYERMVVDGNTAVPTGVDELVLEQRAAFLRPDSVVLVVLLTDEDDCSIRDGGQYFYVAQTLAGGGSFRMPRARAECAVDPEDPCCASCGQPIPDGCGPSPTCDLGSYTGDEDPLNLRCFDQKRRFGIDFLYGVDRYVDGLTEPTIADRDGNVVDNPLFAGGRPADLVVLTGIVGVPWQDIALAPTNLGAGFLPGPDVPWDRIRANPESGEPPGDPLMVASRAPRAGTQPITEEALAPPESPSAAANSVNGHEHLLPEDLQFACIYQLPVPIDCGDNPNCECGPGGRDTNPCCQNDDGSYDSIQRRGRATPSTRQLRVLEALRGRGVVASICTAPVFQVDNEAFAYKPGVDAIMRALHRRLIAAESDQ